MSIIDELLVLLDQFKEIDFEEICKYLSNSKKQTISSALGRLSAKELIQKRNQNNHVLFSITKEGREHVTDNLKVLKELQNHNNGNKWQMVVFNIPENNRKIRDLFRRDLTKLGFGRLQDSSWLSIRDRSAEILELARKLKIENNITILTTSNLSEKKQLELISKLNWDWKSINNQYQSFINQADAYLNSKTHKVHISRRLVYFYAQIVQYDPKLPLKLLPKNNLTYKAYQFYSKIRPYCYQNN